MASKMVAKLSFQVERKYEKSLCYLCFQGPHHFDRRQRLGTVRISQMRNNNGAGTPVFFLASLPFKAL